MIVALKCKGVGIFLSLAIRAEFISISVHSIQNS